MAESECLLLKSWCLFGPNASATIMMTQTGIFQGGSNVMPLYVYNIYHNVCSRRCFASRYVSIKFEKNTAKYLQLITSV